MVIADSSNLRLQCTDSRSVEVIPEADEQLGSGDGDLPGVVSVVPPGKNMPSVTLHDDTEVSHEA